MKHWLAELDQLLADGNDVIRIVVAATKGSAPREAGAAMLVHAHGVSGTLGGGNLEFNAIGLARDLLNQPGEPSHYQRFSLAAALGQCCGGIVDLWWERFTAVDREFVTAANAQLQQTGTIVLASLVKDQSCHRSLFVPGADPVLSELSGEVEALMNETPGMPGVRLLQREQDTVLLERLVRKHTPLWLFGAGHVGQAIVAYLRDLPFDVTWIDSRDGIFPADLPANVTMLKSDTPEAEVRYAPDNAWFLVLTHDHALDYAICAAILDRATDGFIGLIGSRSKAAKFSHKLKHQGYQPERITCPIGIPGISGKEPSTIALAVLAQLIQLREAQAAVGYVQGNGLQHAKGSL
jgi:xanthine dehydrogenase accessory factor